MLKNLIAFQYVGAPLIVFMKLKASSDAITCPTKSLKFLLIIPSTKIDASDFCIALLIHSLRCIFVKQNVQKICNLNLMQIFGYS